jgi:hypothetical protein
MRLSTWKDQTISTLMKIGGVNGYFAVQFSKPTTLKYITGGGIFNIKVSGCLMN